jgi:hypothetical protein
VLLGLVAAVAVLTRPSASLVDVVPTVVGTALGLAALGWRRGRPQSAEAGGWSRRTLLCGVEAVGATAATFRAAAPIFTVQWRLGCRLEGFEGGVVTVVLLSYSAGGMSPQAPCSRGVLNQSTHSRVASSTWSMPRQGPRRRISSVLYSPIWDSAAALSEESPTDPTEATAPAGR